MMALKILSIPILIIFYYHFVKKMMIEIAKKISKAPIFKVSYPIEELKGVIEIILIVSSHLLFAFTFSKILGISLLEAMSFPRMTFSVILLGALLGIGQMALSTTLCYIALSLFQRLIPKKVPSTIEEWVVQSRSGWIRHHFDAIKHLPFLGAVILITLQITSEETVFRGVLMNYLMPYSPILAILASCLFFVLIQAFLMPRKIASMFPIIGAVVIGLSNGIIYYHFPCLPPLIISHAVFFFFSLI